MYIVLEAKPKTRDFNPRQSEQRSRISHPCVHQRHAAPRWMPRISLTWWVSDRHGLVNVITWILNVPFWEFWTPKQISVGDYIIFYPLFSWVMWNINQPCNFSTISHLYPQILPATPVPRAAPGMEHNRCHLQLWRRQLQTPSAPIRCLTHQRNIRSRHEIDPAKQGTSHYSHYKSLQVLLSASFH